MPQEWTPDTVWVQGMYTTARYDKNMSGPVPDAEAEFERWYKAEITAAEQRGKIKALREAATIIRDSKFDNSVKLRSKKIQVKEADWLDALADRLKGDNETH